MVKSYPFRRTDADDLIIVGCYVNEVTFPLVVDTGASHTVIDFGVLVDAGLDFFEDKKICIDFKKSLITID